MKTCTQCNTEKPLDDFYKKSDMKDGHQSHCKECNKVYLVDFRELNPGYFDKYYRQKIGI